MNIAIHAADLDDTRIDGTRVYISNVLKYLGDLSLQDNFYILHKKDFNPLLAPEKKQNYFFKKLACPIFWTQLRFASHLILHKPNVVWLPMHNAPLLRTKNTKIVITIHDLAFKEFSEMFPIDDLKKINFLTDLAIKRADRIIAISNATKKDILKYYPQVESDKISVVYHGFDSELFSKEKESVILKTLKIEKEKYFLYVGAIQPRKNLELLINAFEKIRDAGYDYKLVIAGPRAWKWESTIEKIKNSRYKDEIIETGMLNFEMIAQLYQNAAAFIFPSLYEGFGIPLLEAFASKCPVIAAKNSSLIEIGEGAALFFETLNAQDLADKMEMLINDKHLVEELRVAGLQKTLQFSWEKCARETLNVLKT